MVVVHRHDLKAEARKHLRMEHEDVVRCCAGLGADADDGACMLALRKQEYTMLGDGALVDAAHMEGVCARGRARVDTRVVRQGGHTSSETRWTHGLQTSE